MMKELETGLLADEREGPTVALELPAKFIEAGDVGEQFLRVGANAAAGIGFRKDREVIGAGGLADFNRQPARSSRSARYRGTR